MTEEKPAICGLCPEGCWVQVSVCNGKLVSVRPDADPLYGNLCRRGKLAPRIVYSEDRIKTPLIRTGAKGAASFRSATWDEALDLLASKLKRIKDSYGANAVASYMGAGTLEDSVTDFYGRILAPFGSPNDIDCGSMCYVSSRILAPATTMGIHGSNIRPDIDNADVIIIWGTNPLKDGLPEKRRSIESAKRRGARLIVVDPRRNGLAKNADLWVPVRPGTDGALALALINIVIRNKWYDEDFVLKWTMGFEALREYAALFSPDIAGEICGIDPGIIKQFAAMISGDCRVTADFYSGVEYAPSGTQTGRAIYSLLALLGSIDTEGGLSISECENYEIPEHEPDRGSPALGADKHPLFYALTGKAHISGLADAVLCDDPYPVRGLLLIGGSPLLSHTDPSAWRRIYGKLDFMVVVDRFMTAETKWADIILPAATYYETESYQTYRNHIRLRNRIIQPVGGARSDAEILAGIAERLGYGSLFPKSQAECRQKAFGTELKHHGKQMRKYESGNLRSDREPGFPTPSGRFEFESVMLKRYGYDALPVYIHPYPFHDSDEKLVLTTGARSRSRFNSQYLNHPELVAGNDPVLEMNPVDAVQRGIASGDSVFLSTECGEISLIAKITGDIREGTVHAPSGGGGAHQIGPWSSAHVNSVIPPESRDAISGYPVFKAQLCEVNTAHKAA